MIKFLNRNHLKIIALVSMLIDHMGFALFGNDIVFRILGRVSFPIFAFFVAEGYRHTRNRKKYVLTLAAFTIVSQLPYTLLFSIYSLNTLATYLFSFLIIYLMENKNKNIFFSLYLLLTNLIVLTLFAFNLISYGFFGVYLAVAFYFISNIGFKVLAFVLINTLITLPSIMSAPLVFRSYLQLFAFLAIPVFLLYNNKKGKRPLKYLFYIFYPVHMILIYIATLIF